jgi:REP element-mobilizing transposase RayT
MPLDVTKIKPRRNSLRYEGFDYTSCGAYFVTICTYQGQCLFGDIANHEMQLNPVGLVADQCWWEIPDHFPHVQVDDEAVVMPNHTHGIVWIVDDPTVEQQNGPQFQAPANFKQARKDPVVREFGKPIAGSLSTILGAYKAAVTRKVNEQGLLPARMRWHRNFWDHIIRNDDDLERCRSYIRSNAARWDKDALHPDAPDNEFNAEWRKKRKRGS